MTTTSNAPDDSSQATSSRAIVSLRSASFGYADRAVVSDVTMDIHAGEIVAILGPNGSGKSTLVKGLLGLNNHLGGQVALFDTPIDRFHDHARLGYVPQRHTLSTSVRATVAEVVAIGRLPHQSWLGRAIRTRRCWPPERVLTSTAARSSSPTTARDSAMIRRSSWFARPSQLWWGSRPICLLYTSDAADE